MVRRFLILTLCAASCLASTPAAFRGRIVEIADQKVQANVIFVMGRNGSLRKVVTSAAQVIYAEDVPQKFRKALPAAALKHGAEVRVTAEEDGHGVWQARHIEILHVPGSPEPREKPQPADRRPRPTLSTRKT